MRRTFVPLDLVISEIEVFCRVWEVARSTGGGRAAWVRLFGACRDPHDAIWIQWRIDEAAWLTRASALLIDLRELDATAGQAFAITPRDRRPTVLALVRPESRDDIAHFLPAEMLITDLDAGVAELEQRLRTKIPRVRIKRYQWTEVWIDAAGTLRTLHHAGDTVDVFDPSSAESRRQPLETFPDEEAACAWLRDRGFARVEGRL